MELANILELIHAVSDSDLTEFNLQDDTLNISMSKEKTIVQQMAVNTDPADAQQYQPVVQQAVHVESVNAVNDEVQTGSVVKSPLVGTYYAASSPENPPFVKVGDKVSKGQILGIVEAMKLMNEIESEFDGYSKRNPCRKRADGRVRTADVCDRIEEGGKKTMKLTTKEIMEIIPHRHPFLLIDTIEELGAGCEGNRKEMCYL